jgi:hypothetical protein
MVSFAANGPLLWTNYQDVQSPVLGEEELNGKNSRCSTMER